MQQMNWNERYINLQYPGEDITCCVINRYKEFVTYKSDKHPAHLT